MSYKKSQTGWIVIIIMAPIMLFLTYTYLKQWGDNPIPTIPFILIMSLLIFCLLLFYKLTIRIEDRSIKIIYGIGIIKFSINIDILHEVTVIRTPWWYGYGIKITPKGMLYNIHGSKAVRLEYRREGKSKTAMIGTPEPEKLKDSLIHCFGITKYT